jgi:hypothetical protein
MLFRALLLSALVMEKKRSGRWGKCGFLHPDPRLRVVSTPLCHCEFTIDNDTDDS